MTEEPTIHIIDDDADVRAALGVLLESKGRRFMLHDCAENFLRRANLNGRGCVVTDVRMAEMNGIELLGELKKRHSPLPVIVITAFADVPVALQAMKQGAIDLLEKPFDDHALLNAVDNALALDTDQAKRLSVVKSLRQRLASLTQRERQVLAGLIEGRPNKIIAYQLGINIRTVETHRATVMKKMQAHSLAEC